MGLCAAGEDRHELHSPFWVPKEWDQALNRRNSPLFLNEGYPLTLDEHFAFALPAKIASVGLPPTQFEEGEPLRWRVEWARIGDDKLVAKFHAELARGELSPSDTAKVQQQIRSLFSALGRDASFACR